jgi:hypothetical protein
MSENRCGTCRYWGHDEDAGKLFRRCLAVVHAARGTDDEDFMEDDATGGAAESVLEHLAVVEDGSGYYAALKTQADFSCSLWEATDGSR